MQSGGPISARLGMPQGETGDSSPSSTGKIRTSSDMQEKLREKQGQKRRARLLALLGGRGNSNTRNGLVPKFASLIISYLLYLHNASEQGVILGPIWGIVTAP